MFRLSSASLIVLVASALSFGAACSSTATDEETDTDTSTATSAGECLADSCSGHGVCDGITGKPVCTCEAGYRGAACDGCATGYHTEGSACAADETCEGIDCGTHGACEVVAGSAECECETGYAGADCGDCAAGYHLDDASGSCIADEQCLPTSCAGHGTCTVSGGLVSCDCETGYDGAFCEDCALGYHAGATEGDCVIDETCDGLDCGPAGTCVVDSGIASCECTTGNEGALCDACSTGYQDIDNDDICKLTCDAADLPCGGNRHCDDSSGTATCVCDDGYQDVDSNETCEPTCETAGLTVDGVDCNGHGPCAESVTTGLATCTCESAYNGDACNNCSDGYQDNDHNGFCLAACINMPVDYCGNGVCVDTTGLITCSCETGWGGAGCAQCADGYTGVNCDACATGYVFDAIEGVCNPVCSITVTPPNCNGHGSCADGTGVLECACTGHWTGPACDTCAEGYSGDNCDNCGEGQQDNDGNGVCSPACAAAIAAGDLTCSATAACDDTSGTATCVCNDGYTNPPDCSDCSANYYKIAGGPYAGTCTPGCSLINCGIIVHQTCVEYPDDFPTCVCDSHYVFVGGKCEPDCTLAPWNGGCSSHGTCYDNSGTEAARCNCDTGYQDKDKNSTCTVSCDEASMLALCSQPNQGCDDADGTAKCVCDPGYVDVGGSCEPLTCATPDPCAPNGSCDASSGHAECQCSVGWAGTTCTGIGGDTCAATTTLALPTVVGAPVTYHLSTTAYTNDLQPVAGDECDDYGDPGNFGIGKDIAVKFSFTGADKTLKFEIMPVVNGLENSIIYIRSGDCATGTQVGCNDDKLPSFADTLSVMTKTLSAGTYYLILDGWGFEPVFREGEFDLQVTLM